MTDDAKPESAGRRRKIVRLIEKYGLHGIGDEMERRWTVDTEDRMSLRALADHFNRRILAAAMSDTGESLLDGEVENLYRLLTSDDVSEADRTRARRRLERNDVVIDEVETDFVTYQAVRGYLKDHRGVEYSYPDRDRTAREAENFKRLRGRTTTVVEGKLEQLRRTEDIRMGAFRTLVSIGVICEDCGTQHEVDELLERGGCDCRLK